MHGELEYGDEKDELRLRAADLALLADAALHKQVLAYSQDTEQWRNDAASAWQKLQEVGQSTLRS